MPGPLAVAYVSWSFTATCILSWCERASVSCAGPFTQLCNQTTPSQFHSLLDSLNMSGSFLLIFRSKCFNVEVWAIFSALTQIAVAISEFR